MKAEILANGMLVITPENPTETFALSSWWDRYQYPDKTYKPTSLKVNLIEPVSFDAFRFSGNKFDDNNTTK